MIVMSKRILCLFVLLTLFCQPVLAEEGESSIGDVLAAAPEISATEEVEEAVPEGESVRYVAVSRVALKIRRGPGKEYGSSGSISKGALIQILSLGTEWSKIRTPRTEGYIQSQFLSDIRDYDAASDTVGSTVRTLEEVVDYTTGSTEDFHMGYKAHAVKPAILYAEKDPKSKFIIKVPTYKELTVSHVEGDWCYAMYKKSKGWVRCDSLFKWDRIDPYAGDIPGCIVYPTMAFLNRSVDILDYSTRVAGKKKDKVLKTVLPGSAICIEKPDEEGRYKTPYWRTTGFVTDEDIAYTMDVVPYAEAQIGDLISVMTTYYAVGVHTLQYQGRNWNIYLSTTMLSGTILQPAEVLNVNKIIGPYRKSTGYKPAPIASPTALWGYGGGTCQVNTTLYNTVIQLPIFVNHRKVHANVGAKYFLKGFDAAVGGGDINMIFTNTLPYPIRFNFFLSDGVLTCGIFRAG